MKRLLLLSSIVAAALTVITFGGWHTLWLWEPPARYSAILVCAAAALRLRGRAGSVIAGVAALIVVAHFIFDMVSEWREYRVFGAGVGEALWLACTPIYGPAHLAVALIVLSVATSSLVARAPSLR